MRQKMIDERVSLLSKRSAYKNKGLRIGEINTSRMFIRKGPIKANQLSPPKLDLMSTNFSQTQQTLVLRKPVRPQTAPTNKAMIRT